MNSTAVLYGLQSVVISFLFMQKLGTTHHTNLEAHRQPCPSGASIFLVEWAACAVATWDSRLSKRCRHLEYRSAKCTNKRCELLCIWAKAQQLTKSKAERIHATGSTSYLFCWKNTADLLANARASWESSPAGTSCGACIIAWKNTKQLMGSTNAVRSAWIPDRNKATYQRRGGRGVSLVHDTTTKMAMRLCQPSNAAKIHFNCHLLDHIFATLLRCLSAGRIHFLLFSVIPLSIYRGSAYQKHRRVVERKQQSSLHFCGENWMTCFRGASSALFTQKQ